MTITTEEPCHPLRNVVVLEPSAMSLLDSFTPLSYPIAAIPTPKSIGLLIQMVWRSWGERENVFWKDRKRKRLTFIKSKLRISWGSLQLVSNISRWQLQLIIFLKKSRCHRILNLFLPLLLYPKLQLTQTKMLMRKLQMLDQKMWSSNLSKSHSTVMILPNIVHVDLKWVMIMNQFLKMLGHLQHKNNRGFGLFQQHVTKKLLACLI